MQKKGNPSYVFVCYFNDDVVAILSTYEEHTFSDSYHLEDPTIT